MAPDAAAPVPVVRRRVLALGLMLLSAASAPAHATSPVQNVRAQEVAAMATSLDDSTASEGPLIARLLTADTAAFQIQLRPAEPEETRSARALASHRPSPLDLSFADASQ